MKDIRVKKNVLSLDATQTIFYSESKYYLEEKIFKFQKKVSNQNNAEHQYIVREADRWQNHFGEEKGHSFETENKENKKSKERLLVSDSLIIFTATRSIP